MYPADLPEERDLALIFSLVKRISHTLDLRVMAVGINAIEAILEGNPHFRQVRGFTELTDNLYKAQDTIRARELAHFICSRDSTSQQQQQQQERMEVSGTQQQLLQGKEAGIQPSAVSGPLETKKPAQPVSPGNSAGPSQQLISTESLSELTQPPPSSAGSFSEVIQPAEDFTLLSLPGQGQGRHIHTQHGLLVHVQHLTIAGHLPGCWLDIFAVMGDLLNCSIADVLHAASLTHAATVFHTVGIRICAIHIVAGSGVGPLNCVLDSGAPVLSVLSLMPSTYELE
ncbi:unnamed protein product [Oreochromis niloticus]|nr:unnamed protein product [Mustela putorius furo]